MYTVIHFAFGLTQHSQLADQALRFAGQNVEGE